jgi:AcrR family transcriptional regulator
MKKPNARERILETAGKLFHQRGYSEVGINEIISEAETAKASFYQHYPSKEALCEAWLQSVHEKSDNHLKSILETEGNATSKLSGYFDDLRAYMIKSEFRGCPYSNTGVVSGNSCTGIREQILEHKDCLRCFFRELAFQECGDRKKADKAGDRIFLIYSGATTEAQNLKEIWPVDTAQEAALQLIQI